MKPEGGTKFGDGSNQREAYALLNTMRFAMVTRQWRIQDDLKELHEERMKFGGRRLRFKTVQRAVNNLNDFISSYKPKKDYPGRKLFDDFIKFKYGWFYPVTNKLIEARRSGSDYITETKEGFNIPDYERWVDFINLFVEAEGVSRFEIVQKNPAHLAFANLGAT